MALIKCQECWNQVSDKASSCPKCGNPLGAEPVCAPPAKPIIKPRRASKAQWVIAGFILVAFIVGSVTQKHDREVRLQESKAREAKARAVEEAKTPAQKRKEKIEAQFSAWDGSHSALESYLKKHLNDPGSYEHVKTTYRDAGAVGEDMILVECTYRAKNAFGALILGKAHAVVDLDGHLLEVTTQ